MLPIGASAGNQHWTAHYQRFGGVRPIPKHEQVCEELFEHSILRGVTLEANSLREAVPKIRALAREAGASAGISFIILQADYEGYLKPLSVKAKELSLAALIDAIAAQGDFYWDFRSGKLTLRPTR